MNVKNDCSVSVFLSSLHLQFHGGCTHFRLPGGPLQQKDHSEQWNFLLVLCDTAKLLYYQRCKCHISSSTNSSINLQTLSLLKESYCHDYHSNLSNINVACFCLESFGSCSASWVFLATQQYSISKAHSVSGSFESALK